MPPPITVRPMMWTVPRVSTVIAGEVAEHGFGSLRAPIAQVTGLDATIPYSEPLEAYVLPDEDKVVAAVRGVLGTAPVTA